MTKGLVYKYVYSFLRRLLGCKCLYRCMNLCIFFKSEYWVVKAFIAGVCSSVQVSEKKVLILKVYMWMKMIVQVNKYVYSFIGVYNDVRFIHVYVEVSKK